METEKGTAEREASRGAETRPEGSTRVAAAVGACKTEMGAYRTLAAQGETQGGIPAPWEPNQEARLVGGAASGVCTAAVSDSRGPAPVAGASVAAAAASLRSRSRASPAGAAWGAEEGDGVGARTAFASGASAAAAGAEPSAVRGSS